MSAPLVPTFGKHTVFVRCGYAIGMRRCARIVGHAGQCSTEPLDGCVLPMGIVPSLGRPVPTDDDAEAQS